MCLDCSVNFILFEFIHNVDLDPKHKEKRLKIIVLPLLYFNVKDIL